MKAKELKSILEKIDDNADVGIGFWTVDGQQVIDFHASLQHQDGKVNIINTRMGTFHIVGFADNCLAHVLPAVYERIA